MSASSSTLPDTGEVLELSVEETNKLRASLGLKPLRVGIDSNLSSSNAKSDASVANESKNEISLSVEETNVLRAQLGMKPLKETSKVQHAPARNEGMEREEKERLETEETKRQVEDGLRQFQQEEEEEEKAAKGKEEEKDDMLGWAQRMRRLDTSKKTMTKSTKKKQQAKNRMSLREEEEEESYNEDDLKGMTVAHSKDAFEAGTTTVLTLADTDVLQDIGDTKDESAGIELENVNLKQDVFRRERLKELQRAGVGSAGGGGGANEDEDAENADKNGFVIGKDGDTSGGDGEGSAHVRKQQRLVSLDGAADNVIATDFLTAAEYDDEKQEQRKKRKKKDATFSKKKKKKKKSKRRTTEEDEEGNEEEEDDNTEAKKKKEKKSGLSLLDELEATADNHTKKEEDEGDHAPQVAQQIRKRRRHDDDDDDDVDAGKPIMKKEEEPEEQPSITADPSTSQVSNREMNDEEDVAAKKRRRFEQIMDKGNADSTAVFSTPVASTEKPNQIKDDEDGKSDDNDDDDAFLAAALEKARRLQKLRELTMGNAVSGESTATTTKKKKGAEAVLESLQQQQEENARKQEAPKAKSGITFEFDETTEFTRALAARAEQAQRNDRHRQDSKKPKGIVVATTRKSQVRNDQVMEEEDTRKPKGGGKDDDEKKSGTETDADEDMAEMAKKMEEEEEEGEKTHHAAGAGDEDAFGSTGTTVGVGKGLASVIGILKKTGEISGKHAGREEMKGRARDVRTYEDYEPTAATTPFVAGLSHPKDVEMASRAIKLEYRDEHGHLLTRKEAFRQLCYDFHGYGSSKKNEERRLRQMERHASSVSTDQTLGALQATQQATGKAFVIHRTN